MARRVAPPWATSREIRRYDGMRSLACETDQGPAMALIDETTSDRLDAIAAAHARVSSPFIANVVGRGELEGQRYLLFDCDAVTDLEVLMDGLKAFEEKVPYAAAIAFNEFAMDAFECVHEAGAGYFGAFGLRCVLASASGRTWLFGLGANFPIRRADGALMSGAAVVEAPELIFGTPPTAASDVYLLHATLRSLLPFIDLHPMFQEAMGRVHERGAEIYEALISIATSALEQEPHRRVPDVASLRRRYRQVRALVPELPQPDFAALASVIAKIIERDRSAEDKPGLEMKLDGTARVVTVGGEVTDLSERSIHWRIVARLAEAHASGAALSVERLAAAGWPDEKLLADAARARVYVAISALRKTPLGRHLQKSNDGYFFSPGLRVVFMTNH